MTPVLCFVGKHASILFYHFDCSDKDRTSSLQHIAPSEGTFIRTARLERTHLTALTKPSIYHVFRYFTQLLPSAPHASAHRAQYSNNARTAKPVQPPSPALYYHQPPGIPYSAPYEYHPPHASPSHARPHGGGSTRISIRNDRRRIKEQNFIQKTTRITRREALSHTHTIHISGSHARISAYLPYHPDAHNPPAPSQAQIGPVFLPAPYDAGNATGRIVHANLDRAYPRQSRSGPTHLVLLIPYRSLSCISNTTAVRGIPLASPRRPSSFTLSCTLGHGIRDRKLVSFPVVHLAARLDSASLPQVCISPRRASRLTILGAALTLLSRHWSPWCTLLLSVGRLSPTFGRGTHLTSSYRVPPCT